MGSGNQRVTKLERSQVPTSPARFAYLNRTFNPPRVETALMFSCRPRGTADLSAFKVYLPRRRENEYDAVWM